MPNRLMRTFLKTLVPIICIFAAQQVTSQIVINEIMANNQAAVLNQGIYPDWVELHNRGTNAVDISDWSLSHTTANPREFIFPLGTVIPASGYLIVWCDQLTNAPGLHANFNLNRATDDVLLYAAPSLGGVLQDTVVFGWQLEDLTIGRLADTNTFTLNLPTPGTANQPIPLGTVDNLKINEIMADPAGGDDWIELYNPDTNYVHFGGLIWSDRATIPATNRAIPNLSFIAPGGFIQFFADNLQNRDADQTDFRLSGSGESVVLFRPDRTNWIDRIDFGPQTEGVSYGRLPDGSTNLVFFAVGRSTPAASNFQLLTEIVINEVLSHTDPALEDAIELYNPTGNPVDISNWWLSNARDDPKKFQIPTNTIVPAGGYIVFYEYPGSRLGFNSNGFGTNRSFTLNSARGDQVYLHTADAAGNLTFFRTSRDFGPAENGVSFGRYVTSDTNLEFVAMSQRTFGADNPSSLDQFRTGNGLSNAYPKVGPLVINEIMYHPPDIVTGTNSIDNNQDEFIEIHNPTTSTVILYDPINYSFADGRTNTWRIRGVVDFDFPTNVSLAAGAYLLVVNFDPQTNSVQLDAFRSRYSVPTNTQIFGPYSSELGNANGEVELLKPDLPQPPGRVDAFLVPYIRVDRVEYDDDPPWPVEADGTGPSLQRLHAFGYGNDPTNWIAAAASAGTRFLPNSPPVISPIPNVVTNEMQFIQFAINATDTNLPAQTLTYFLEPGAPAGATIDRDTGLFRWSAKEEQGPNTYPVTVRVTDNGSPPASSTATFNITVSEVNRPPSFNIRERWVKAGERLAFFTASDPDVPANFLAFSFVGATPEGIAVHADTGEVTWTPTAAQATNAPYRVTVRSADDGTPQMTASYTYTIHVVPSSTVLIVIDIVAVGPDVFLTWKTTLGKTYLVEFTETLDSPNWVPISDLMTASGDVMSVGYVRGTSQGFYRVSQRD